MKSLTWALLTIFIGAVVGNEESCRGYCSMSDGCWPADSKWSDLINGLDGTYAAEDEIAGTGSKRDTEDSYADAIKMKGSEYYKQTPFVVIYVKSETDVQKCIHFAKENNIRVTIQSSGHDYIGRSTGTDSLMINLSRMTAISASTDATTRSPYGEITAEAGATWKEVYRKVNSLNRVVVGGSAPTVTVSGYTMGGGHSPIVRKLGLAVDNLLEVRIVTVDVKIIVANAEDNTDLFWALRGGGGGTYGVATKFTFKLHEAPNGFLRFMRTFAINFIPKDTPNAVVDIGKQTMDYYTTSVLPNLPDEWGGYIINNQEEMQWPEPPAKATGKIEGFLTFAMIHFGNKTSPTASYLDTFSKWKDGTDGTTPYAKSGDIYELDTLWDVQKNVNDPIYLRTSLANALVPMNEAKPFAAMIMKDPDQPNDKSYFACTHAHIGGASSNMDPNAQKTSVNSALRSAIWSTSCALVWEYTGDDATNIDAMKKWNKGLDQYRTGTYVNEPNGQIDDWKTAFWPATYDQLLVAKKKYDPSNFLQCRYCVGYDLDNTYNRYPNYTTDCFKVVPVASVGLVSASLYLHFLSVVLFFTFKYVM